MKSAKILSAAASMAVVLAAAQLPASAAGDIVYGTMNIPYTEFYAAELGSSAYEVDAVTSATKNKALRNGEGELFEGSYNNGVDTILGVTYPVAISRNDLTALGDNNYGFQELDSAPAAYKNVTVNNGTAAFSAVQDASPETIQLEVKLSTETPWGDYLIDLANQPEGFDKQYRGAILKTADGKGYAMRHEQNLWRGEIAWSSGIKTSEPHGNQLDYAAYENLMGSTVTEIVLITRDGYVNVPTNTYIPVKFANSLTIENAASGTGSTTFATEGFPSAYQKEYEVGDNFTVTDGTIRYTDAKPGNYTLKITDSSNVYAPVSASFTLTTDDLPVQYENGKLVAADGFTDEDAANFIQNLSSVTIGETTYSASGRGAVKIFDDEGTLDFAAQSRAGAVFADGENGNYTLTVSATGYNNSLTITIDNTPAETTTTTEALTTTTSDGTATTGSAASATTTTTRSNASSSSSSTTAAKPSGSTTSTAPKTGDTGTAAVAALTAVAGAAAFIFRKKQEGKDA